MFEEYGSIFDKVLSEHRKKQKRLMSSVWDVGFRDRGMGHGDFAVITKKNKELVVECSSKEIAEHIVKLHNGSISKKR